MTSSDKQTCMLHGAAQKRGGECRREAEPGAQVVSCGVCRHGATSVGEFRDEGYLPDAMTNFLALLGWNEGDGSEREMYSLGELTQAFSLGRITKSGAVFDKTKLSWMNGASAPPAVTPVPGVAPRFQDHNNVGTETRGAPTRH